MKRHDSPAARRTDVAPGVHEMIGRVHALASRLVAMLLLVVAGGARADIETNRTFTFTNGILPVGTAVFGSARATNDTLQGLGGYLALTRTVGCFDVPANDIGSFVVDDFNNGSVVSGFDIRLRKAADDDCNRNSFEQVSYSFAWGNNFTNGAFGELGTGTNLIVTFVREPGGVDGYIDVRWQGRLAVHRLVSDTRGFIDNGNYIDMRLTLDADGDLSVSNSFTTLHNFTVTLTNFTGLRGAKFGWGARSIFNTARQHRIDDLSITTRRLSGDIAGAVTRAGRPEAGVSLTLFSNNVEVATLTTGGDGRYFSGELSGVATNTYRIRPAKAGLTFDRDEATFTGRGTNIANFQVVVYEGRVVLDYPSNTRGMPGVTVQASNSTASASVVTDDRGYFSIVGLPRGSYRTEPLRSGLSFLDRFGNPSPRSVTLGADTSETTDAIWRVNTASFAAGYVRGGGVGLPGVTVSATNGGGSTLTDARGFYVLGGPFHFPDAIVASMPGLQFQPALAPYSFGQQFIDFDAAANLTGWVLNPPTNISSFFAVVRLPAPDGRSFSNRFAADGTFVVTNVPVLAVGELARLAMPEIPGDGQILPASLLVRPGQGAVEAAYFEPEPLVLRRFDGLQFPPIAIAVTVTPALPRSVLELDTTVANPGSTPWPSNIWTSDKIVASAALTSLNLSNRASFAEHFAPAASGPFGVEVTNWPVVLRHGPDSVYTFHLTSADDAALYLDGSLLSTGNQPVRPTVAYRFDQGLPAGSAVFGSAQVVGGALQLNPLAGGQSGAFLSDVLVPGREIRGFTARFQARVNYEAGSGPADGFSFNWATDLPAGAYGEDGAGTGLRVTFDTFNNGPSDDPGISLWWGGLLVTNVPVGYIATTSTNAAAVFIRVTGDGRVDVAYGGRSVFTGAVIPGFQPLTGARIGFGSRTGGSWEFHTIDDLEMELDPAGDYDLSTRTAVVSLPGGGSREHTLSLRYLNRGAGAALRLEWELNEGATVTTTNAFAVTHVFDSLINCGLGGAESLLSAPTVNGTVRRDFMPTLNYGYNTYGRFPNDSDYNQGGASTWVTEAVGTLHIPTGGAWTFGVRSDDGFGCWIGTNSFSFGSARSPGDSLATFTLAAGDYPVRLVAFNCVAGAELEFFAAPGTLNAFDGSFRLVGDPLGGGLAVSSSRVTSPRSDVPVTAPVIATFATLPTSYTNAYLVDARDVACKSNLTVRFTPRHLDPFVASASTPTALFTPASSLVEVGGSAEFVARGGYSGRVVDSAGYPMVGVSVRVQATVAENECQAGISPYRDLVVLVTDADGRFQLSDSYLRAGALIFQPELPGSAFNPPHRIVATPSANVDFSSTSSGPRFGSIPDQVMNEDTVLVVPFTVNDAETPASQLVVTAGSGNPVIVPNTGLAVGGSGANRTLTIRPVFNGSSPNPFPITLTANDRVGNGGANFSVRTVVMPGFFPAYASYVNDFILRSPINTPVGSLTHVAVINFTNSGFNAAFDGATEFPGLSGPTDHFILEIVGSVTLPTGGAWTFGVRSDDGFLCTVGNNSFTFDGLRGAADSLATFNLNAGTYPIRIVYFEQTGGAGLQFFAAPGTHAAFNDTFRLVGDIAHGGLEAGGTDTSITFNLTVNPVNDPPTAGAYTGLRLDHNSIEAPGLGGLASGDQLTIEFWQKVAAPQPHETMGVYPADGQKFIRTYVPYQDGRVYFDFGDWTGPGRLSYQPPESVVGSWQHWAFVADRTGNGGDGVMQIYRNGQLEAERLSAPGLSPNNASLFVGGQTFQGDVAEFRVWNTARTAREIQVNKDLPLRGDEPGLLAYYRFNEGSGQTVFDNAPLAGTNSAVFRGNPSWLRDPGGSGAVTALPAAAPAGMRFNGNYLSSPNFGAVAPTTAVTVEFWSKTDAQRDQSTFRLDGSTLNAHIPWSDGRVYFDFGNLEAGRISYVPPQNIIGTWQHWALVADQAANGDAGMMRIYRNGVLEAEQATSASLPAGGTTLQIGAGFGNFLGELADFRIWNLARTEAEILAAKDAPLAGNEPGLILNYRFLEGAGNTVADSAPLAGNNAATSAGNPLWLGDGGGVIESGLRFENSWLDTAHFGLVAPTEEITVEYWQFAEAGGSMMGVGQRPNVINTFSPFSDGRVYWDFGEWLGGGRLSYQPAVNVLGSWQHWAFVASRQANNGAGVMRIYRNGVLEAEQSGSSTFSPRDLPLNIGATEYGRLQGRIAEFRIWNVARSGAEIQLTRDTSLRGNEPGLLLYYRFREAGGPVVNDRAPLGGNNVATFVGENAIPTRFGGGGADAGYVHALPADEDNPRDYFLPAFDFDHPALTYSLATPPTHGTLTQVSGGVWRYLSATNYSGPDSFVYTVTDGGGLSASARIHLAVSNVNDVPTISGIPNQIITESELSAPIPFIVDDGDGFPELLEITAQSSDLFLVRPENISFQGTGRERTLTILPQPEQSGTLTITLTVSDGIDQIITRFDVRIEPRPVFSLEEIGAPSGRPFTFGTAINDRGAVAAYGAVNNSGQQPRAYVNQGLDNGQGVTELGTLGGASATPLGINLQNDVVGVALTAANQSHAFRFDGVTMADLGTLSGGTFSQATAINDAGLICGFGTVTGVKDRAFLYREGVGMQDLGTLPGYTDSSRAFALNSDGDVVGASFDANGHSHAFLRRLSDGTMIDLGTLGGADSVARGINRFDHIVGGAATANQGTRAFLWRDGVMQSLGTLPGGTNSEARAINEFGQVVGYAFNSNGAPRAFLFTQGQMFDLNDLITEEQQLAGWVLTDATAINRRGEIAGTGFRAGQTRGFLLVPAAVIGRQVIRPQGTFARLPEIELLKSNAGDTKENSFFFSEATGEKKLYATRPVTARIKWYVTDSVFDTNRVSTVSISVWPKFPQIHVATAPVEVEPGVPEFAHKYLETRYISPGSDAAVDPNTKIFTATNPAYTVLMYLRNNGAQPDPLTQPPYFEVARTLAVYDTRQHLPDQPAHIGAALQSPFHRDYPGRSGYVYFPRCFIDSTGEEAAYNRNARTGPILPVNRLTIPRAPYASPLVVVWYATNRIGVSWGHKSVGYKPDWDPAAPSIVIASGQGAGFLPPNLFQDIRLYNQPNTNLPGFNPNEEHALILPGPSGDTLFALRNDLNTVADYSDPYALLKYRDPQAGFEWRILPHRIVITNATHRFVFTGDVGKEIQPPFPLSVLGLCQGSKVVSGPGWQDKNGRLYARAAGTGLNDAVEIVTRYQYPLQPGFQYDLNRDGTNDQVIGTCVPWLDRRPGGAIGESVNVTYSIRWPTNAPTLQIGETLLRARRGLPDLANFASAEIVFDSTNPDGTNYGAAGTRIFDPLVPRVLRFNTLSNLSVPGVSFQLPASLKRTREGGRETFDDLPPDLIQRLTYDPQNRSLSFAGTLDETVVGQPLLLLNVLTPRERDRLLQLDGTNSVTDWDKIILALYQLTRNPNRIDLDLNGLPDTGLFLGLRQQTGIVLNNVTNWLALDSTSPILISEGSRLVGRVIPEPLTGTKALIATGAVEPSKPRFITIAENNTADATGPVTLHVIRVDGGPYPGDLKFLTTANIFSEKLNIRHSADFGAEPEALQFEWYYKPDSATIDPTDLPRVDANGVVTDPRGWLFYSSISPADGTGVNSITLGEGGESSLLVLGDNWFIGRYRGYRINNTTNWTGWIGDPASGATPRGALAEGWIKRVVRGLNPFDSRTADFHSSAVNTFASMLQQAGARYEGDIALNNDPAAINSVGLIEAYSTVFNRGRNLSIEGIPAVNFDPANNALLLAASRISDLYMLLGNEAYADAQDPTIGFGTTSGEYGTAASSVFAFQNQVDSLLEEELGLLRGRDSSSAGVAAPPVYNRLFWNFTLGEGEVAYRQAYNVTDVNRDGFLDERDARLMYPQGHGDAWGHYLTAAKTYYSLMRHPQFTWVPRTENVLVAGAAVQIDYLDERKFARAAAAKARAGAEIVNLTYRQRYVDDTTGQWQGYKDAETDRAWGVTEWARRAGQGAFFDWVSANALLPSVDPNPDHTGLQKIDRQTVLELGEIPAQLGDIQKQLDQADIGLNPIGLVKGAVPFDIDPTFLEVGSTAQIGRRAVQGLTQFDQILERAISALNNAVKVWNQANKATELLRRNQDSVEEFTLNVIDQERDYKNRLIEIFGYPYAGDIGPGQTYPGGYDGPDLYHWMYVNTREISGESTAPVSTAFTGFFRPVPNGYLNHTFFPGSERSFFTNFDTTTLETSILQVNYPVSQSAASYTFASPASWGSRRAPGKVQEALSDVVQEEGRLKQALQNYDGLIRNISDAVDLLQAQYRVNAGEIEILNRQRNTITSMNATIGTLRATQIALNRAQRLVAADTEAIADGIPRIAGLAFDVGSPIAGIAKGAGAVAVAILSGVETGAQVAENSVELAKERVGLSTEINLRVNSQNFEVLQRVKEIEAMMRDEAVTRLEVFTQREVVAQASGRFLAALAEGDRLLAELKIFRQRAAAQTSSSRYQDMTFRIFRNDALQKYRAAFDVAARYVYLAANAYDFEVNFNPGDPRAGRGFLTDIIRQRSLGEIVDGDPAVGQPGLADPLARLDANWAVLKTQFGVINPQITDTRFSLREELFRIKGDADSDATWRDTLTRTRVANLWDMPEFRRFCRPFVPEGAGPQPGIVIRFPSTITFGLNYFGWPLAGGDNNYDSSQYSTKISRAGVWLSGSDGTQVSQTPRVYLVPVGMDVMRSPSGDTLSTREWRIFDQAVPAPFPIGPSSLNDPKWIPQFDSLGGSFADIRRYGSMIAKHDSGIYAEDDLTNDTRLIGRSAWNTDWLLIIPGGTLLNDPNAGLEAFINTVTDIKIYFQTYSYSGN